MYGTIMRARVKQGLRADFEKYMGEMTPPSETGFHGVVGGWEDKDPDRLVLVVFFRDKESYVRNADDQKTQQNYAKMLEYLDGGVEWLDVNWEQYMGKPLQEGATAGA